MQGEQEGAQEPETDAPPTVEEPEPNAPEADESLDEADGSLDEADDDAAQADDPDPDADIDLPEASDEESDEPLALEDDPDAYVPWTPPERRHRGVKRLIGLVALAVPAVVVGTTLANMPGVGKPRPADERWAGSLRYDGSGDPLLRAPGLSVGKIGGPRVEDLREHLRQGRGDERDLQARRGPDGPPHPVRRHRVERHRAAQVAGVGGPA
ncbi:MAG: hypothetical protein PGN13_06440 [Patulibacter minatonensis]